MSLTAYGCGFDFRISSVTYMLYLIYYRAGRCYSEVNWRILNGIDQDIALQPNMPTETHAVFRTLIFSIFYLCLSIFLIITCVLALCESRTDKNHSTAITHRLFSPGGLRRTGKSRHLIFWLYFAPFIVIFVAIIVMDLIASGYYLFDYFSTLSVNGLMRILEIRNQDEMRPILDQITLSTRTVPQMIMFAACSKCVLFLILNIVFVFLFTPACWRACTENQDIIKTVRKMRLTQESPEPVAVAAANVPPVSVRVRPAQQDFEEAESESSYEPQPAYNPHVRRSKSVETHF